MAMTVFGGVDDEEELLLDYSDLERRAHIEIPVGVDWRSVPCGGKSYSELFDNKIELATEED